MAHGAIAKTWWEQEFPGEPAPADEQIGEEYFRLMSGKGRGDFSEGFSCLPAELESSAAESRGAPKS